MERRGFLKTILALGIAPAIVKASSLLDLAAPEKLIALPVSQDIVVAHSMPTREQAQKLWPGADLHAYEFEPRGPGSYLCIRDDGILVMGNDSIVGFSLTSAHPLRPYDGDIRTYVEPAFRRRSNANWRAA